MNKLITKTSGVALVVTLCLLLNNLAYGLGLPKVIEYYDFSSLTNGVLADSSNIGGGNNQGNWYLDANNGQKIWDVETQSGGIFDGQKFLDGDGRAFNLYSDNFFDGTSGLLVLEGTVSLTNTWQGIKIGVNGNGDSYRDVSWTIYMQHFSPLIGFSSMNSWDPMVFSIYPVPEDGSSWSPVSETISGLERDDYYGLRLIIDPSAYNGEGSGTLYYRNVSDDGDWIKIGGAVENVNVHLDNNVEGFKFSDWNQVYLNGSDDSQIMNYTVSFIPKGTVLVIE